jgi:hypothetical protein
MSSSSPHTCVVFCSLQLVAVLVMGAIPHSSESGYTDYADPNNLRPDADKSVSVGFSMCATVLMPPLFPFPEQGICGDF